MRSRPKMSRAAWMLSAVLLPWLGLGCAMPPQHEVKRADGARLTIATYNLHFPAWNDPSTLEAIAATGADVVFLQEVTPEWQAALETRYRDAYPHRLFTPAPAASGLGVLSRLPLRDPVVFPPIYRHPASLVSVSTPLGELRVLNVHLRAAHRTGQNLLSGLWTFSEDHETEIRSFVTACGAPPELVLGDFNEGPGGAAIRWLLQNGYADTIEQHHPSAITFRAWAGLRQATYDHILAREPLRALDARVIYAGNSDHFPVVVRF